jgi:tetratricopeptide (TPR) repeat protein
MSRKTTVWFLVFVMAFVSGCRKVPNDTLLQQKAKMQTVILQLLQTIDSLEISNEYLDSAKDYIDKANEFGAHYPEDPMSAELLYKAGLMSMTVAKTSDNSEETYLYSIKALTIFDDIQRIYPDFTGVRNCLINKGIVCEDILHDYKNAEIFYREFIARYPTDTLAINLEAYLPYLGTSPEDIISEAGNKKR